MLHPTSSRDCNIMDIISDSTETAFSLHLSTTIFVFDGVNAYHVTQYKYSNVTDIQTLNVSNANFISQIVDFPTHFPSKFKILGFLIYIFSPLAELRNIVLLDQSVVSIYISFQSSTKQESPLHKIPLPLSAC